MARDKHGMRQDELDANLMQAAYAGAVEIVRSFLELGANPLKEHEGGTTALMLAADSGRAACVRMLGPVSDIGARDHKGRSAFHFAADSQSINVDTLAELLALGGSPGGSCHAGKTPLMMACANRTWGIIEMLLPCSDILSRGADGLSALDIAVKNRNNAAAQKLLPLTEQAEISRASPTASARMANMGRL